MTGLNRKTGFRNRRNRRDSAHHLAPRSPLRDTPRGDGSSFPLGRDRAYRPSHSPISIEREILEMRRPRESVNSISPQLVSGLAGGQRGSVGNGRNDQPRVFQLASAPQPDSGRTWDSEGRFGNGRLGGVRRAADITAGIAGNSGAFAEFVLDKDILALLRKGATEALGGQLDLLRGSFVLRRQGVKIPLMVNLVGQNILGVVDFRKDPSRSAPGVLRHRRRRPIWFSRLRICLMEVFTYPTRRTACIILKRRLHLRPARL